MLDVIKTKDIMEVMYFRLYGYILNKIYFISKDDINIKMYELYGTGIKKVSDFYHEHKKQLDVFISHDDIMSYYK